MNVINLDKKDDILLAIEGCNTLKKNPKKIIKSLYHFKKPVPAANIIEATGLSKAITYVCLSRLLKSGLIIRSKPNLSSCYVFENNPLKMIDILELQIKTKSIKNKI